MPPRENVPGAAAAWNELLRFADAYDPTPHLQKKWGDDYLPKAQALFEHSVTAYRSGVPLSGAIDEMLFCLTFALTGAPHLCFADDHGYLRFVVAGIRQRLSDATPTE
jgi:hypothetical protein